VIRPVEQAAIELARVFLAAFREAMDAELVDPVTRDRVLRRLTDGEPS